MYKIDDLNNGGIGYVRAAFSLGLLIISSVASFSFFYTYAPGLLATFLPGTLANIGAGLIGVFITEGALVWWIKMMHDDASTDSQITIAKWAYVFSLILAIATTVFHFLLTSTLIRPFMTDQFNQVVSLGALVTLISAIAVQLYANREYDRKSDKALTAKNNASLRAMENKALQDIQIRMREAEADNLFKDMSSRIPKHAKTFAKRRSTDILQERGSDTLSNETGVANPTRGREPVSANGRRSK